MKPMHYLLSLTMGLALTLTSCTTGDSCETQMCHNGGICIDGLCDCPERYTGNDCNEQVTPDVMRITAVQLLRFPGWRHDDQQWDETDGPDVFFKLVHGEESIAQPEVLIENADATLAHLFHIKLIDVKAVTDEYKILLFDYEALGIEPQFMGEIAFTPYQPTNGFPTEILLDNGGPIAFHLTVEYLYKHIN